MAKQITAIVIDAKMAKTITVDVARTMIHPKYHKILKRKSRFKVHNDDIVVKTGDKVLIEETKPYSKDTHYKLVKNLKI